MAIDLEYPYDGSPTYQIQHIDYESMIEPYVFCSGTFVRVPNAGLLTTWDTSSMRYVCDTCGAHVRLEIKMLPPLHKQEDTPSERIIQRYAKRHHVYDATKQCERPSGTYDGKDFFRDEQETTQ